MTRRSIVYVVLTLFVGSFQVGIVAADTCDDCFARCPKKPGLFQVPEFDSECVKRCLIQGCEESVGKDRASEPKAPRLNEPVVKKVFHLTAKSWIDGQRITEVTWRGKKFRFEQNVEPQGPGPNDGNDFKIYQTFVAEVQIAKGKIASAVFLPESRDQRAGPTRVGQKLKLLGRAYVVNERVTISTARDRASFVRTVEATPSYWIVYPDAFDPLGSTNFTPISNTLRLEVTPSTAEWSGAGTAFPSHKFWIGQTLFASQAQIQPSAYFK